MEAKPERRESKKTNQIGRTDRCFYSRTVDAPSDLCGYKARQGQSSSIVLVRV